MMLDLTRGYAERLDDADALRGFRSEFHIPKQASGQDEIYLCGNSLGLQPKCTTAYVEEFLRDWATLGVKGHFDAKHAWMPYHEYLTGGAARLVGAQPAEVVTMNSLTTNLHLLMVSFYRPIPQRYKILIEDHAFPSDHYAVVSQLKFHGIEPERGLVLAKPRVGEQCLRREDVLALIEQEGDTLALVLLPGVQYWTGEVLDMAAVVEAAHRVGATAGLDLAHAVGNVPLSLHDWQVDFAVWCSYKYLNSGAGSVAGAFVHERHLKQPDLPRFAGWWGHDKATRFQMGPDFQPIPTVESWQLSNPPILSLAAVRASLDVFDRAGGVEPLRQKSLKMTNYLRGLISQQLHDSVQIVTPSEPERHGCQLSLILKLAGASAKKLQKRLEDLGVVCDFREPNALRVAPVPLYNRFTDCFDFVQALRRSVSP